MLYKLTTANDISVIPISLPIGVAAEIKAVLNSLDSIYGVDRDWQDDGGYILLIEDRGDLERVKNVLDYDATPCEYAMCINSKLDYVSALYLFNNEYGINLICPKSIAPQSILAELEEEK